MDALESIVFDRCEALGGFEASPRCALALSGGVDSMALWWALQPWVKARNAELIALIIDHGLRTESTQEAAWVAQQITAAGGGAHILTLTGNNDWRSVQSDAREARYAALGSWCKQQGILHLFVAHHGDDQRETLVQRFLRGSGVMGLQGMQDVSIRSSVRVLRPLLMQTKASLLDYMQRHQRPWVEDSSNTKDLYQRNRLRKAMDALEVEGMSVQRAQTLVDNFRRTNEFLYRTLIQWCVEDVSVLPGGLISFALAHYRKQPEELRYLIIRQCVGSVSQAVGLPRLNTVQRCDQMLLHADKKSKFLLNGCLVLVDKFADKVIFMPEARCMPQPLRLMEHTPMPWGERYVLRCAELPTTAAVHAAALGVKGVAQLREVSASLPTLPVEALRVQVGIFCGDGLEQLVAVPHIGYFSDACWENAVQIEVRPHKALADHP
jgi:tRNA(Ile)-lysidine synthase